MDIYVWCMQLFIFVYSYLYLFVTIYIYDSTENGITKIIE